MIWLLLGAVGLYFVAAKFPSVRQRLSPLVAPLMPLFEKENATRVNFNGHVATTFASILYLIPLQLVGLGMVNRPMYSLSLWSVVMNMLLTIKANFGTPPVPQNLSGLSMSNWRTEAPRLMMPLKPWLDKAMSGNDFHWLFFALIFTVAYPSHVVIAVLGRRSLWCVCTVCAKEPPTGKILGKLWSIGSPYWAKVDGDKALSYKVLVYSALFEIVIGLWLLVSLALPSRQILPTILYANYLKTRFLIGRAAEHHKTAWGLLGQQIEPILSKVPILRKPIEFGKKWFQPG